jgi:hypothetical protein
MPTDPDSRRPSAEKIERLQRRRTRLLTFQALVFLLWQTTYFSVADRSSEVIRTVDHVKIGAYIVWAAVLLLFLATGGGYIQPKEVRAVLNDELTIDHRRRAMTLAFLASMGAAVAVYLVNQFEPLSAGDAIHAILTVGVFTALVRFAMLERRAQKDG